MPNKPTRKHIMLFCRILMWIILGIITLFVVSLLALNQTIYYEAASTEKLHVLKATKLALQGNNIYAVSLVDTMQSCLKNASNLDLNESALTTWRDVVIGGTTVNSKSHALVVQWDKACMSKLKAGTIVKTQPYVDIVEAGWKLLWESGFYF